MCSRQELDQAAAQSFGRPVDIKPVLGLAVPEGVQGCVARPQPQRRRLIIASSAGHVVAQCHTNSRGVVSCVRSAVIDIPSSAEAAVRLQASQQGYRKAMRQAGIR